MLFDCSDILICQGSSVEAGTYGMHLRHLRNDGGGGGMGLHNRGSQYTGIGALAEMNRSRVVQALCRAGSCTRAELARATGLTSASITNIVRQFLEWGVAVEGESSSGRGRGIGISLNENAYHVIGIKFARDGADIGVFSINGKLGADPDDYASLHFPSSDAARIVAAAKQWVHERIERDSTIAAIGIAVPWPYLREEGRMSVWADSTWSQINFDAEFADAFNLPVYIDHDVHCAVLALALFSPACADSQSIAYMRVGDGVGLGVLDHGHFVGGDRGLASELGHISIDVNGRRCGCNGRGCLERYCSTMAVHQSLIDEHPGLVPGADALTAEEACRRLIALADSGNKEAAALIEEIGTYIGYGCVITVNGYNPRIIVIGDTFAGAGQLLLARVRSVVRERALKELSSQVEITFSDLSVDPVLCGAAALAVEHFLEAPTEFVRDGRQRTA